MSALEILLAAFVVTTAALVAAFRDLIGTIAIFGAFSLGLALVWLLLAAPDVALTEAAVGAGVVTVLFLIAVMKTSRRPIRSDAEHASIFRPVDVPAAIVVTAVALPLAYSVSFFPPIGDPTAPAVSTLGRTGLETPYVHYVEKSAPETGVTNAVAAVLVVYRGLDTFGEVIVAFAAVVGVLIVLRRDRILSRDWREYRAESTDETVEPDESTVEPPGPYVNSPVVTTAVRTVVPLVFAFGGFLTLQGTVSPGGGFQGGVVLGAAFVLLGLTFGHGPTGDWIDERVLLATIALGVGVFVAVAFAAFAFDGTLLEVLAYPIEPSLVAEIVEIGIGLLVGGVVTALVLATAIGIANGHENARKIGTGDGSNGNAEIRDESNGDRRDRP